MSHVSQFLLWKHWHMICEMAGGFYGSVYHRKCNTAFYEWLTSKWDLFMINVHLHVMSEHILSVSQSIWLFIYLIVSNIVAVISQGGWHNIFTWYGSFTGPKWSIHHVWLHHCLHIYKIMRLKSCFYADDMLLNNHVYDISCHINQVLRMYKESYKEKLTYSWWHIYEKVT